MKLLTELLLENETRPSAILEIAKSIKLSESNKWKQYLYELTYLVIRGPITPQQLLTVITNKDSPNFPDTHSMIVDILWCIGLETEKDMKEERTRLIDLIKELRSVIPAELLKERLEGELLQASGIIQNSVNFQKKLVRLNTKDFYTQTKFNLFREESEGYSKLIVELNRLSGFGHDKVSEAIKSESIQNIQSIIGYFDLDPHRIIDVILEVFENNTNCSIFLQLLDSFQKSSLICVLGFKYQYYQSDEVPEATPKSLQLLTASLIKNKKIELSDVYPHLKPSDEDAKVWYEKEVQEAIEAGKRVGLISLGGPKSDANKSKEKSGEKDETQEDKPTKRENQKLGLLEGILEQNEWKTAEILLKKFSFLDPSSHSHIAKALCKKIDIMIEPIYRRLSDKMFSRNSNISHTISTEDEGLIYSYDQFISMIEPVLDYLGIHVYQDVIVYAKLCRLFRDYIKQTPNYDKTKFEKILSKFLLPALSLISSNPAIVNEVWEILKSLPYQTRYRFYYRWKIAYTKQPLLIQSKAVALRETKKIMRRLSIENVKQLGRMLGKISHNNPIIVFGHIVEQIQHYDNLIQPVVDSLKYITALNFDVITYLIIESLMEPKARLKSDGTNIAQWLQGLITFVGVLYKKHPRIELNGLLHYIFNQMKDGNSLDLLVLKELIAKMSGIEILEDISDAQLESQSGGETLRTETAPIQKAKNLKRTATQLLNALKSISNENSLIVSMFTLISLQRSAILYRIEIDHLKQVGDLYDKCQECLIQYIEFISTHVNLTSLAGMLPSLTDLCNVAHVEPECAFALYRHVLPVLYDDLKITEVQKKDNPEAMEVEIKPERSLVEAVRSIQPPSVWAGFSPELYIAFWSLTLYDIHVPHERYQSEIQKQKQLITSIDEMPKETSSKESTAQAIKRKKEKEAHQLIIDNLEKEHEKQIQNHEQVMKYFQREKGNWLQHCEGPSRNDIVLQFLQICIFPRCVFTSLDSIYCAKFVDVLHRIGTPFFSTLQYYDKVFKDITHLLLCCTENEASRLGRFLCETLSITARWRDEKTYEKECLCLPGFSTSFSKPDSSKASFQDFVRVNFKWHCQLARSFMNCLESKEYMEIRNSLIVLTKLVKLFPVLKRIVPHLEKRVNKIREEDREDLKVLAGRYHALLQTQKQNLLTDEEFKCEPPKVTPSSSSSSRSSASSSSASSSSSSQSANQHPSSAQPPLPSPSSSSTLPDDSSKREQNGNGTHVETPNGSGSSKTVSAGTPTSDQKTERERERDSPSMDKDRSAPSTPSTSASFKESDIDEASEALKKRKLDKVDGVEKVLTSSSSELKEPSREKKRDREKERERQDKDKEKEKERDRERITNKEKPQRERSRDKDKDEKKERPSLVSSSDRDKERERDKSKEKEKEKEKEDRPRLVESRPDARENRSLPEPSKVISRSQRQESPSTKEKEKRPSGPGPSTGTGTSSSGPSTVAGPASVGVVGPVLPPGPAPAPLASSSSSSVGPPSTSSAGASPDSSLKRRREDEAPQEKKMRSREKEREKERERGEKPSDRYEMGAPSSVGNLKMKERKDDKKFSREEVDAPHKHKGLSSSSSSSSGGRRVVQQQISRYVSGPTGGGLSGMHKKEKESDPQPFSSSSGTPRMDSKRRNIDPRDYNSRMYHPHSGY
eukprot:TRINITY_DN480_c0_g2_i3.p1 TRINITY_DN480_c0_g2~~TRINITY_DN480_c0_g2_i3.p1  ORF type:complete len:1658 (-),score=455.84 TRINITY_DN480_c0_g2_i3:20-4993(-)